MWFSFIFMIYDDTIFVHAITFLPLFYSLELILAKFLHDILIIFKWFCEMDCVWSQLEVTDVDCIYFSFVLHVLLLNDIIVSVYHEIHCFILMLFKRWILKNDKVSCTELCLIKCNLVILYIFHLAYIFWIALSNVVSPSVIWSLSEHVLNLLELSNYFSLVMP